MSYGLRFCSVSSKEQLSTVGQCEEDGPVSKHVKVSEITKILIMGPDGIQNHDCAGGYQQQFT
jgi:hypothetical protein